MATKVPTDAQWQQLITNIKAKANLADLADVANTGEYSDLLNTPTIGNAILNIKVNGEDLGSFAANATENAEVDINVPTTAADLNALPDTTKYGAALDLSINDQTYILTAQLKDQAGENLGEAKTIDLPLETMVISGNYITANKSVELTLQNGEKIEFSVADLVSGLQTELSAKNKLDPAYVDLDDNHQFLNVSQVEKLNALSNIKGIGENLTLNSETGELTAKDTTYTVFGSGVAGLVPATAEGDEAKFLAGDGTWKSIKDFDLPVANSTTLGGVKVGAGLNIAEDGTLSVATFSDEDWANLWK